MPSQQTAVDIQGTADRGATIWLTGLPSAGKSTVARAAAGILRGLGRPVEILDGDEIRNLLGGTIGFDKESRDLNVQRIGWLALLLARNGVTAVVAAISPYRLARDNVRTTHEQAGVPFVEIHVAAPVECCAARDVKGLYAGQRRGDVVGLTGVDDPYEEPLDPELTLRTDDQEIPESVSEVVAYLKSRGLA